MKSHSYAPDNKVWLNSKCIKTKCNQKPENKFFDPFQVFYLVKNYAYKLKLPTKQKIYNIFYISLLEQNITRKRQVNKLSEPEKEFETEDNKKYKVKTIINSIVYGKEVNDQILGLYYLVLSKSYLEKESTQKPLAAVIHLQKLINTFH